jgi:tetratricopeptide (TPR) repeat protein
MKTMKKLTIILAFILVQSGLMAQDFAAMQQAFSKSYDYEKTGDYKKAADALKTVYNDNSYEVNLRLGWLNYNAGLFEESQAHYQRALTLMPYSEEARFGIVLPAAATGKWDFVIKTYNDILQNSPGNTIALYRLGLIYYGKKDYAKALTYFDKVVNLYPFGYDGILMDAWTNFQLGKTREAKILFNKTLILSPNDKSATEGLSLIK